MKFPFNVHPDAARALSERYCLDLMRSGPYNGTQGRYSVSALVVSPQSIKISQHFCSNRDGSISTCFSVVIDPPKHIVDGLIESEQYRLAESEYYRRENDRIERRIQKIKREMFPK